MRLQLALCLFVGTILTGDHAQALFIEPYLSFMSGGYDMRQSTGGENYNHEGFHLGVEPGIRAGIFLKYLAIGGVAAHTIWHQDGRRIRLVNPDVGAVGYTNTFKRNMYGGMAGIYVPGKFKVWGEYYPYPEVSVNYSKDKVENYVSKKDAFDGKGWGAGVGFLSEIGVAGSVMYRYFRYDRFRKDGVKIKLPDGEFWDHKVSEFTLEISFFVDFFK